MDSVRIVLLVLVVSLSTSRLAENMDEEVGEAIFHDGEFYIVYVYKNIVREEFVPFREYCELPETMCTTMSPSVEIYDTFIEFIGEKKSSYFIIIDANNRKKYVMGTEPTVQNFKQFESNFKEGKLKALISSEDDVVQDNPYVTQLVGNTIYGFLHDQSEKYKIVLFVANSEICESCPELVEEFKTLAKKMEGQTRQFAYMDLVKNQHPQIQQEKIPVVSVYKAGVEIHAFSRFFVIDLQQKILALERGETLPAEQEVEDSDQQQQYEKDSDQEDYQDQEKPLDQELGQSEIYKQEQL